ncbi:putative Ankyrin repeats (3 copies) Ankyrin repeat Ankyrin repeats (many copies) [Trypanosoma vivax]|uniref:Uncharacterized protein n=1 Tax=Trypanosoma vivax (strain Y486) TaxID=1055687 RepID=G0U459_TRYVY|nr:hypothetical protein TRVL_00681 [Trypanosoma vivax]KAH8611592.1 putative Ankyrin repeats (3 copies) Ankyrin repeat Ankyrin repeats (many copies) [Trypanosoma vivax]CCC52221.1 conserved hypothetical protein [Trypanosoma vivax Y486]
MQAHLSELCKNSEVQVLIDYLSQLCPGRAAEVSLEEEQDEHKERITGGFACESNTQMFQSFNGIWAYQDDDGRTALHWAISMKNFALASRLMCCPYYALAFSADHDDTTPFMTACTVSAPVEFLTQLLIYAAAQRRWNLLQDQDEGDDVVRDNGEDVLAVHRQAIVNHADVYGNTALLHAAGRGYLGILRFLLHHGASISHTNKRGQSALHRASSRGFLEVAEELVAASRKVHDNPQHIQWMNAQDYRGDTALFYASMDNNEELGRYLLRQGADRNIKNKEGKEFWEV